MITYQMKKIIKKLATWTVTMKRETLTLYCVIRDLETPIYLKILCLILVSYALSPIDLIPDFIPVIGFLDDLLILSFGIYFILKLLPENILLRSREKASYLDSKPVSIIGAIIILTIWIAILSLLLQFIY